jgi:MFS family permease
MESKKWINSNVLLISFSAFFADLGYQTAVALFPVFLVLFLKAPVYEFGIANAVAFGVGSIFGYAGGVLGDRFNDKWIAVLGNALIPILSLTGLAISPTVAVILFASGWWARNFRSPSRRKMLVESTNRKNRGRVFGFLHALDIGGGMFSIVLLLVFLIHGLDYRVIFLITAIPITISTVLLLFTRHTGLHGKEAPEKSAAKQTDVDRRTYKGIILATSLYGFSSYSLGFPILTIAQSSNSLLGIGSYAVYLGVSAVSGYIIGSRVVNRVSSLAKTGYILSGIGTFGLAFAYLLGHNIILLYASVAVLGFSLGAIETLEPTIISFIKSIREVGSGMGSLSASRSIGIFLANLIMGLLYVISPFYSYAYAGIVSIAAGCIVLYSGRGFVSRG